VFFGSWAEWFFTQEGFYDVGGYIMTACPTVLLPWVYSVFYNGLYMVPEILITAVTAPLIHRICEKSNKL
jgi:thiamine transporter